MVTKETTPPATKDEKDVKDKEVMLTIIALLLPQIQGCLEVKLVQFQCLKVVSAATWTSCSICILYDPFLNKAPI